MKNLAYLGCLLVLPGLLAPSRLAAQALADSSTLRAATAVAHEAYSRHVRPESVLFNGPEYVDYVKPGTVGHQFFLEASPQMGTVSYRQGFFQEVPLRYDIVLDQVVMTYPSQTGIITLVPDFINTFSLGSHQFARLLADSAIGRIMPTGYYEVLQPGPVSLLAHHTKRIQQIYVQQTLRFEYRQTDQLYVRTATGAAEVGSLKSLLSLLPAHKTEAQRYARQHNLRFAAAQREASALELLRYYYTLPQ